MQNRQKENRQAECRSTRPLPVDTQRNDTEKISQKVSDGQEVLLLSAKMQVLRKTFWSSILLGITAN